MEIQYLYSAEATKGEEYCFISPFFAEAGDHIVHNGEIFIITKRVLYYAEDDAIAMLARFIQIHPADAIYTLQWKREETTT